MTKDQALKHALEKFEYMNHVDSIFHGEFDFQINAIKKALAQKQEPVADAPDWDSYKQGWEDAKEDSATEAQKQEPVAWAQLSDTGKLIDLLEEPCNGYVPLYTSPPQRQPLNHHEFGYWWFEYGSGLHPLEGEDQEMHAYRVATEAWKAAHGIKGEA